MKKMKKMMMIIIIMMMMMIMMKIMKKMKKEKQENCNIMRRWIKLLRSIIKIKINKKVFFPKYLQ